jgi:hypothetical protein
MTDDEIRFTNLQIDASALEGIRVDEKGNLHLSGGIVLTAGCDFSVTNKGTVDAIQAAVLAEREECAKIADEVADDPHASNPAYSAASNIAVAIRARGSK